MPEADIVGADDAPTNGDSPPDESHDLVDIDDEAAAVGPDLGA